MEIGIIIQARMDSRRFPGKVLYKVQGKPLLQYLLERLRSIKDSPEIIVATSLEKSDNPIVEFCSKSTIPVFRGSLANVAERFRKALDSFSLDGFVRISGDSPLLDQRLIEDGIKYFLENKYDLVTNVWPRTFPSGQSVEVIKTTTFQKISERISLPEDQEHVTRYFYRHSENFSIMNFSSIVNHSKFHLSIDDKSDIHIFQSILKCMQRPHWNYHLDEIIPFYLHSHPIAGKIKLI